ncbi:hypothetical protein [Amycolatopsis pigmentata]|uniref:WXG100 family type VII secretion target n=1 Tax=Amycolatopsis pigmentata TaxID=450801 RepID=A0ABW5G192_9PSEU
MADDITSIDIGAASEAFKKISKTTDDLTTAFGKLTTNLAAKYGCWGTDDTGNQFAKEYVKNYNDYIKNGVDLTVQLEQNATDLNQVPAQVSETDQQNADNLG